MKIMTWNVDWFRNGKRSGEDWEYYEDDSSLIIYKKIKNVIEDFLDSDSETVVCLQEVPYKADKDSNRNHELYKEFFNDFQKNDTLTANHNWLKGKWSYARTMVISRSRWDNSAAEYNGIKGNKVVQIVKNAFEIMVVHIPPIQMRGTDVKEADENREIWQSIIEQCRNSKPHVVLGDFNTDSSENEQYQMLQKLKKIGYLEPEGFATEKYTFVCEQYKSHVDYILVREDYIDKVRIYDVLENGVGLSDHRPLIVDINI